jgi:hypothetical protein
MCSRKRSKLKTREDGSERETMNNKRTARRWRRKVEREQRRG